MIKHAAGMVAVVVALGGLVPFHAGARSAVEVEVLYEGEGQAAICNATSAIVLQSDFADPPLWGLKPTAEVERLIVKAGSDPVRQKAAFHSGWMDCHDDYVWSIADAAGHRFLSIFHWPFHTDTQPTHLGIAADVDVAGPGLVFVPPYPTETVQERRRRHPGSTFLMLPEDGGFYPVSAVRIGTSNSGLPLVLATGVAPSGEDPRIAIIEAGRDPVRLRKTTLKMQGASEHPQAAHLSTLGSRPLLQFSYRDPAQPTTSYIVGAAVCVEPGSVEAPTVDCSPLVQLRLPFGEAYPSNLLKSELDEPPMLTLPQGGARAFVAIAARERTCIRVTPLNASTIADTTGDCPLEVAGQVLGMAAASDSQLLVVSREDRPAPTFRLLRISGL